MICFACLSPHPPLILPTVGSQSDREKVKNTINALEKLAPELAKTKPDLLIISSPHPDWGIQVPLFFLLSKIEGKLKIKNYQSPDRTSFSFEESSSVYPILTTLDSAQQHFEWGKEIAASLPKEKRVAWIASGDMSHCLRKDGSYGFRPEGPKYDRQFIDLLKKKDLKGILNLDPRLVEEAGECGLRSFCLLLGVLEKTKTNWQPKILSYEGPFGVGYLVSRLI